MKRLTLRQRLLLLTLLPSTLISIALMTYFTVSDVRTLEGELRNKGLATVRYLAPISEYSIISGQSDSLHSLAQATMQDTSVKATLFVNQRGRSIAVSGRVSLPAEIFRDTLREPMMVADNEQWMAFGAPVLRSVNDADALFEPIFPNRRDSSPEVIGQVFVEIDKSELYQRQSLLWQRGLLIVAVGMVLIVLLSSAMANHLAKPLMRLVIAVRSMSTGRLDVRVPAVSEGEFGELEKGFNEMAGHIEEVHSSMQQRIEEATAQLAFQARHDALTGLLNRREFEQRLEKALISVQSGGEECSVLFIDLDRFKPVNDNCGHLAGDELLRQISQLFQSRLREEDTFARLGGDEFGVLLINCGSQRARLVAEDLCALAGAYRFIWQDRVFAVGASIGLTVVTPDVHNIMDILAAGDAACYQAKEQGRGMVCEHSASTPERRQETNGWQERIVNALAQGRLQVEAMPIVKLQPQEGRVHLVELVGRLQEPGERPIALSTLLDAAERYDLAPAVDRYFIDTAIAALARVRKAGKSMHCLVSLSATSLQQSDTEEYIATRLEQQGMDGQGLCLLITEETATRHAARTLEFVRNIRAQGCQIGLDDFGGGLSSFSHLRAIMPDCIKLNASLTHDIEDNHTSLTLLRAIREIAADMGIQSIAAGIMDPAMRPQLVELGLDYAQGMAFTPREPFEVWLEGVVMRSA
jgi:diguanylate cyclase (GGDEF)-like protein